MFFINNFAAIFELLVFQLHLVFITNTIMQLDTNFLIAWGAVAKKYNKGEFIFHEEDTCRFYYQVHEGKIKMCNYNHEGRGFIQGIFGAGESFGESSLFTNELYVASAQAETNCIVYILSKDTLFKILSEYPEVAMKFVYGFAKIVYDHSSIIKNIIHTHPKDKILGFLKKYKKDHQQNNGKIQIPYTRQHLADFLGLRVETVIRTLIKMEEEGKVEIRNHKLYY